MLRSVAQPHHRDLSFSYWVVVGALLVFGFFTGFSIGLPFLALGTLLLVLIVRRGPAWPANLGAAAGGGLVCVAVALLSATHGNLTPTANIVIAVVGALLILASSSVFWWLRCRPNVRNRARSAGA
jgi:uncharacterized membrane protein